MTLPNVAQAAVTDDGHFTAPWRNWLAGLERLLSQTGSTTSDTSAAIAAIATALGSPDGSVEGIPDQDWLAPFAIVAGSGTVVEGTPASGVVTISASGDGTSMPAVMARVSMRA